jgi:hypothetical protein|tara:strand:+ start:657 stop:965 length:309 start_codon:yes stop_codon:yes gene_type:complete
MNDNWLIYHEADETTIAVKASMVRNITCGTNTLLINLNQEGTLVTGTDLITLTIAGVAGGELAALKTTLTHMNTYPATGPVIMYDKVAGIDVTGVATGVGIS